MSRNIPPRIASVSGLILLLAVLISPRQVLERLTSCLHNTHRYLQRQLFHILPEDDFGLNSHNVTYKVRLFSRDPLILYIDDFLTPFEIHHILNASQDQYEPARVFRKDDHHIDTYSRVSSLAFFKRDPIYDRITRRAMNIQGWRGLLAFFQPPYVQRYEVGGFYGEHYDWDPEFSEGNRITTFLVYLSDNCTGGGTNFPRLSRPHDKRWCDIIECQPSKGLDASAKGVTFKPNFGAAIFWENMHVNGSFNEDLLHASLPVLSGVKYGLNIFTWDLGWRAPTASEIPGA